MNLPYSRLCPEVRAANAARAARVRREEQLEADRKARIVALEVMKLILEKPCTIMDLKHIAFPGLSYALDCGWVIKTDSIYELTNAGHIMFSKLEQPTQDPNAVARVLLKARAVGGQA